VEKMKARNIARTIRAPEDLGLFVVPGNEREYDAAVQRLGELMDEIGDHPRDRRYRLIETLGALTEAYDREHHPIPEVSGVDMLRFLIEQHGLTYRDLREIGSARVVSEILRGRRELSMRQLMALAKRFGVPPAAFLPERA
jgi:HTH-type transcriptional regulator/antitoxin HigA